MRIGLDIVSLAHKKQADQIILIAGDSDFILAPMWANIKSNLFEHIDGLMSHSSCYFLSYRVYSF